MKNEILSRTFSRDFIRKMQNRILVSYHKYGDLSTIKKNTLFPRDELKNAKARIKKYEKTGNTEYLIDAANFLMFEFMEMNGHFIPVDDCKEDRIV